MIIITNINSIKRANKNKRDSVQDRGSEETTGGRCWGSSEGSQTIGRPDWDGLDMFRGGTVIILAEEEQRDGL